jgi:hypothetical protein
VTFLGIPKEYKRSDMRASVAPSLNAGQKQYILESITGVCSSMESSCCDWRPCSRSRFHIYFEDNPNSIDDNNTRRRRRRKKKRELKKEKIRRKESFFLEDLDAAVQIACDGSLHNVVNQANGDDLPDVSREVHLNIGEGRVPDIRL